MTIPTPDDVRDAARRIHGRVRATPVLTPGPGAFGLVDRPTCLVLKLELLQHTGSFKPRGAFNRLLSHPVPAAGVVAASGGNHGLAVAYVARVLGVPATVVVPEAAPPVKVDALRALGAQVHLHGSSYAEALDAALGVEERTGAVQVHAYDQPEVVAGQATVGTELLGQAEVDTVLVAVGGGGLVAGITLALEGSAPRVVAVEPRRCPTLHAALAAGEPVDVEVGGLAADSLGARRLGRIAFAVTAAGGVPVVLVSDEDIAAAQRLLWRDVHVVAEPGGATALAALTSGAYVPADGERVAVVVCGANTAPGAVG